MTPLLLSDIETAVRAGWCPGTFPSDARTTWNPGNPARGQCGITALVVHDLLGGDLMCGEVHVNGERTDFHWWNRLGMGVEIDLTREQFRSDEVVTSGVVVPRPPGPPRRLNEEYERLRDRVMERLRPSAPADPRDGSPGHGRARPPEPRKSAGDVENPWPAPSQG